MVEPYQDYPLPIRRLSPRRTKTGAARSSLAGVNTSELPDGSLCVVTSTHEDYQLFRESTDAPDGDLIIAPSAGPGRWFKVILGAMTVTSSLPALLIAAPTSGAVVLTPTPKIVDESAAVSTSSAVGLWIEKGAIQIPAVDGTFLITGMALCSANTGSVPDLGLRIENVTDSVVLMTRIFQFESQDGANTFSGDLKLIFTNTAAAGAKDLELQFAVIAAAFGDVSASDATLVAERLT